MNAICITTGYLVPSALFKSHVSSIRVKKIKTTAITLNYVFVLARHLGLLQIFGDESLPFFSAHVFLVIVICCYL